MAGGEGDGRGWDGWMASLSRWAWVWASSRLWWRKWEPNVLQSVGYQRVVYDWVTEVNWRYDMCYVFNIMIIWSVYISHIDKYAILVSGIIIHRSYWLIMLFWFQVYNIIIWHILQNDHHNKSGEHPSLEIVTIFSLWWKLLWSLGSVQIGNKIFPFWLSSVKWDKWCWVLESKNHVETVELNQSSQCQLI